MAIANQTYEYTANTSEYLPLPINNNIDRDGNWFVYVPVNASNDTTGGGVRFLKWDTPIPQVNTYLTIDGTIPLIYEEVDGANVYYHSSAIEHVGEGVNDITNAVEDDAIIFAHLGANAADDDAFYWDRVFLQQGDTDWQYYQYHKHLPSFYTRYEQGRETTSGGGYIDPEDKSYGYQISTRVSSAGTAYQSRLARIHTPSIGGAHNSHNDVTLPSVGARNYMTGGIIRGTSDKYHAFYLAQNASNTSLWDVYARTYSDASLSFTSQSTIGTYNLADPVFVFNDTSGDQQNWPVRASCGDVLGFKFYIPVVVKNESNSSLYDLQIWEFPSADPPDPGDIVTETIASGLSVFPDCQAVTVGSKIYFLYSDSTRGGVSGEVYDGTTWTDQGTVFSNSTSNKVRVHGFRYDSGSTKFYTLLSGTSAGASPTYEGAGVYSFKLDDAFGGYEHLDYDSTNHTFQLKGELTAGYIEYDIDNGVLTRYNTTEPAGIATDKRILEYDVGSPQFMRVEELTIGGEEYYYDSTILQDGRKCLVGTVEDLPIANTAAENIFITFLDADNPERRQHFVYGGLGQDYVTGITQASDGKIWLSGYTKSELVTKRDIKVHGFLRNCRDGSNGIYLKDVVRDSNNNYYAIGIHDTGFFIVYKFDDKFEEVWQRKFDSGSTGSDIANQIAIDSNDNIYVCGSTVNIGQGSTDAILLKFAPDGTLTWGNAYGTSNSEDATGCVVTLDGDTEYVVLSIKSGTSTLFTSIDLDGSVNEVNVSANLNVNRLRPDVSGDTKGRFLFAGDNGANKIRYGMGEIGSTSNRMIQWLGGFSASANGSANDIGLLNDPDGSGNGADYVIVGEEETDGFVLSVQVDETLGSFVYNVGQSWARTLDTCKLHAVVCENYANPNWNMVTGTNRRIHVVGETTADGRGMMGAENGLIVQYDSTGALQWQNTISFMGREMLYGVVDDATQDNIVSVGFKSSHSYGSSDGMLFRSWKQEFGTGNYHINGNPGAAMWYEASTLTESLNSATISSISAPADSTGSLTATSTTATSEIFTTIEEYDGSFGPNGTFQFWAASIDLDDVQMYINSDEYKQQLASGVDYAFTNEIFTFYQVATVGDGSADDGNVFGYDIIEHSGGMIVPVGVTSGDIGRLHTGASGVYDYLLLHINPTTGMFMYFQNGSTSDEEVYALTELADGQIAFVGRSTGDLGDPTHTNLGGYDIFLAIHDMTTHTTDYYQTGTGFNDVGIGVHDIGNNKLAVAFTTSGAFSGFTNQGGQDIGVVEFNYVTDVWGTAYQTGSESTEFVSQNGNHSALLPDGRIAIVGQTAGFFADNAVTTGLLDIFLGILDPSDGTWKRFQIGTGANDFGTSVNAIGDKLLIVGYTEAAISDGQHGVYLEFDSSKGIRGKITS